MNKFKFRLATLQKLREQTRGERRAALAEAFRVAEVLSAKGEELAAEAVEIRDFERSAVAGHYLDVNRLLEAQRYELLLKVRAEELAKQSALLAAEVERRRQALVEADRDVRVLELLEERQRRDHARKQARFETKQLDEAALAQWCNS